VQSASSCSNGCASSWPLELLGKSAGASWAHRGICCKWEFLEINLLAACQSSTFQTFIFGGVMYPFFHWEAFPILWLDVLLFTHLDAIKFLTKWDKLKLAMLFV